MYAQGENDNESPFTFGSSIPGLTFHWSVSNMDVLSLVSVYDQVRRTKTLVFLIGYNYTSCHLRMYMLL